MITFEQYEEVLKFLDTDLILKGENVSFDNTNDSTFEMSIHIISDNVFTILKAELLKDDICELMEIDYCDYVHEELDQFYIREILKKYWTSFKVVEA